ncbi:NAD(P)H-hydrate dehydratase [Rhodobacteraceae bacterium]|nr:NAD(P)H-hydrate dehydratase [Paracoccaceae bacterium]
MIEILTSAQMRATEQAAIASKSTSAWTMMQMAGHGVAEKICSCWPDLDIATRNGTAARALVLCGPGHNGGDGFLAAVALRARGWMVEVVLAGTVANLPENAARACALWRADNPVHDLDHLDDPAHVRPDVVIDALFGIGVSRPLAPDLYATLSKLRTPDGNGNVPKFVAVDCPSGFDVDRGLFLHPDTGTQNLHCDLCVTFHCPKPGHVLGTDAGLLLEVVDIGLPAPYAARAADIAKTPKRLDHIRLIDPDPSADPDTGFPAWYQHMTRLNSHSHKYARGHAMVLSGGAGQGGAARMCARAALRVGAGLVTLAAPQAAMAEHAAQLNAVMLRPLPDSYSLRGWMSDTRLRAFCVGPGLGLRRAQEMVPAVLWGKRATVLDADALGAYREDPDHLFSQLHADCILTPHLGEFRALFPDLHDRIDDLGLVEVTRHAAARAGCCVLLKGPATVIARPDGACSIHPALRARKMPWLGTAGAGDVLGGMITGLLASQDPQDRDIMGAAELATWLHVEAARHFGAGLIAEDIADTLPALFQKLGL